MRRLLYISVLSTVMMSVAACNAANDTPEQVGELPPVPVVEPQVVRLTMSPDLDGYNPELIAYMDLRADMELRKAHAVIYKKLAPEVPENNPDFYVQGEGNPATGQFVTLVTRENLEDDSVAAIQVKTVSMTGRQRFGLLEAGARVKCRRGPTPGIWQTDLCP